MGIGTGSIGKVARGIAAVAFLAAFVGFGQQAHATVVLDQEQPDAGFVNFHSNSIRAAQSFTVGVTGVLHHIDVHLRKTFPGQGPAPNYNILFSLVELSGGQPTGTVLATDYVTPAELPDAPASDSDFITFDVSGAGINVTAGEMYAFVLTGEDVESPSGEWNVFVTDFDSYADGVKYSFFAGSWNPNSGSDMQFRTFVAVEDGGSSGVPEPGTLAALGFGVIGLGLLRRRRAAA